ncbi:MAG: DUF790 family protein [Candidatus Thermoplasmatota archaeon]|nr:DUF790 family protein [Candidatus Thermoplasmatota archaeon]
MFQWDLVQAKRIKGRIIPVFLPDDSGGYASAVIGILKSGTGKSRKDLDIAEKDMEYRVRYHKVLRAMYGIALKFCVFVRPSDLDPPTVRREIFLSRGVPAITEKDRSDLIQKTAERHGWDPQDVESAIFGDFESESILESAGMSDPEMLVKIYNLELLETLMLRCSSLRYRSTRNLRKTLSRVKMLGLVYMPIEKGGILEAIEIDGPASQLEKTRRYGFRFALLLKYLVSTEEWEIEAEIRDEKRAEDPYTLFLDGSANIYFPPYQDDTHGLEIPSWASGDDPVPVVIGSKIYFPDFACNVNGTTILVDISTPRFLSHNEERDRKIREAGFHWETVYVTEDGKPVRNHISVKSPVDWEMVRRHIEVKYRKTPDQKPKERFEPLPEDSESIRNFIEANMGDADRVIEFIEAAGYNPARMIPALGFTVRWDGLTPKISRKRY